jgi:hypothetical protein
LIAAALDSGSIAVVTIVGDSVWATFVCEHCDLCCFNPNLPSTLFVGSSRATAASIWTLADGLSQIREFTARSVFKRACQSSIAVSCDFALVFCCSTTQLVSWHSADGRLLSRIEGLANALAVVPHPFLPTVVAVVTKTALFVYDVGTDILVNAQYLPPEGFKLKTGVWSATGLAFFAGDNHGGFLWFHPRPGEVIETCDVTEHFFPGDFTLSEWSPGRGQIENASGQPVEGNPRTPLLDSECRILIRNYRPHPFDEIQAGFVPSAECGLHSEFESVWLASSARGHAQTVEADYQGEVHELDIAEEADAVFSGEEAEMSMPETESESPSGAEMEPSADAGAYPFWTTIDTPKQGSYFPQAEDVVVYMREGHLEFLDGNADFSERIDPPLSNEEMWPSIGLFQVINVRFARKSCEIQMLPINFLPTDDTLFYVALESLADLEVCRHDAVRTFLYSVDSSPAFIVPRALYQAGMNRFESLAIGDQAIVYFRKNDQTLPFSGTIIELNPSPTGYNSVALDWGDTLESVSPWEITSVNNQFVYEWPSPPAPLFKICHALRAVLDAAEGNRTLRPLFKQTSYSPDVKYPIDLGLIRRRIINRFYRNVLTLRTDIIAVSEVHRQLQTPSERLASLLTAKLLTILDRPDTPIDSLNLATIGDEAEPPEAEPGYEPPTKQKRRRALPAQRSVYEYARDVGGSSGGDDDFVQVEVEDEEFVDPAPKPAKNKPIRKPPEPKFIVSESSGEYTVEYVSESASETEALPAESGSLPRIRRGRGSGKDSDEDSLPKTRRTRASAKESDEDSLPKTRRARASAKDSDEDSLPKTRRRRATAKERDEDLLPQPRRGRVNIEESDDDLLPRTRRMTATRDSDEDLLPKTRRARANAEDSDEDFLPKTRRGRDDIEESDEDLRPRTKRRRATPSESDEDLLPRTRRAKAKAEESDEDLLPETGGRASDSDEEPVPETGGWTPPEMESSLEDSADGGF